MTLDWQLVLAYSAFLLLVGGAAGWALHCAILRIHVREDEDDD